MPVTEASKIRHIIFDLGGVLLNINPLLSLNELTKISGLGKQALIDRFTESRIFEKFDTGQYDTAQFRSELCRIIGKNVADNEIDRMWNALLLDFPPQRVKMLQELRKNFNLYLLSNTNSIHFRYYTDAFFHEYNFKLQELFNHLYLSYEIGMHKPDPEIYRYVLQHDGLTASECLFVDDSLPNVKAARKLGIAGLHISGEQEVTCFFAEGLFVG